MLGKFALPWDVKASFHKSWQCLEGVDETLLAEHTKVEREQVQNPFPAYCW